MWDLDEMARLAVTSRPLEQTSVAGVLGGIPGLRLEGDFRVECDGRGYLMLNGEGSLDDVAHVRHLNEGASFRGKMSDGRPVETEGAKQWKAELGPSPGAVQVAVQCHGKTALFDRGSAPRPGARVTFDLLNCSCRTDSGGDFAAGGRTWTLEPHPQYRQRYDALRFRLLPAVPTATVSTTIASWGELDDIWPVADHISWLLSLAGGTMVMPVCVRSDDGALLEVVHSTSAAFTGARSFIDGEANAAGGGLAGFLAETAEHYVAAETTRGLCVAIAYLTHSLAVPDVELRLTSMLQALEHLCTSVGRSDLGWGEGKARRRVLDKMEDLHASLFRAPLTGLPPDLADAVRNPLFHEGKLKLAGFGDALDLHSLLTDVFLRLALGLIGYTGRYRDPSDLLRLKDLPPAAGIAP